MKHEIVHVLVTLAMEEKAAHRELASQLVSFLYGHILNSRDVALGEEGGGGGMREWEGGSKEMNVVGTEMQLRVYMTQFTGLQIVNIFLNSTL